MVHWIWLVVAAMAGATVGVVVICIMVVGSEADRRTEIQRLRGMLEKFADGDNWGGGVGYEWDPPYDWPDIHPADMAQNALYGGE